MPVFLLPDDSHEFPPPELARGDGLLAVGGDLSAARLLNAYANGIFPWYNEGEIIKWWSPGERFVIFPGEVHMSRSMKKVLKKTSAEITVNGDFAGVVRNCRLARNEGTWITDEMEAAYNTLYDMGCAFSVEVRDDLTLAGGLYGVALGKCFFGESMFSRIPNASKIALIYLCLTLSAKGFLFVDCQFRTDHLESMGGRHISRSAFKNLLNAGLNIK